MKENLPKDAVVFCWWDYGYWVTTLAEKRTLADNGTINSTQIATIARAFILNETMSIPIMKQYNVSHVAIYAAWERTQQQQNQFYGVGEDSKWYWMAKICNGTTYRGQRILITENRTESDTTYYRKVIQDGKVISTDLISDKQGVKPVTVVGYLLYRAIGIEYTESQYFAPVFNSKKSWVTVFSVIYPEPTALELSMNPKKIVYNESFVELAGRISSRDKGLADMTVSLEYSTDGGQKWNAITTTRSDAKGAYKYAWSPNAGSYLVRSKWDGIPKKFSGAKTSNIELVVDKVQAALFVEPSSLDIAAKQNMTFTCKLSKPLSAGTVTVDYSLDNKTWTTAGYGNVKNGAYILGWAPPQPGKYYIRVVWVADQNYVEVPAKLLVVTAR